MIRTYLQLNSNFLLMSISEEINQKFHANSPKAIEEESKWLKENLPTRNSYLGTTINPEQSMILFNDNLVNVVEFFRTRTTVKIYNKGEFKLTDFVQPVEDEFKNYEVIEIRNEPNWAKDLIQEAIGINSKENFYKKELDFYSNPEIIEEYRKRYPRPNVTVKTAFESFISAIKQLTRGVGNFILIKIN